MASSMDRIYGAGSADAVKNARILVVGAGGVGCELVKNLGISGFCFVTLIDLDTIDVSNLNRQFLFRRSHVGGYKAEVAASVISSVVQGFEAKGIVGNVKDTRFDVDYFQSFDVVCNALDNIDARRHVNRMCLAAGVPLIESGSTGYNGQVTVIVNGKECYDCTPKPAQKTYAVCTIRSTPEKPVHCIVWAKHLWDLVFGPADESNVLRDLDHMENGENNVHGGVPSPTPKSAEGVSLSNHDRELERAETANESGSDSDQRTKKCLRFEAGDDPTKFARRVCDRVFIDDIEAHVAMTSLWDRDSRPPPVPCDVFATAEGVAVDLSSMDLADQTAWSRERSAAVLRDVLKHVVSKRTAEIGFLTFDKDDRDALAFVVSAANLRAAAYGLELLSPFTVQGIAGNIVHAIASTNAMVAGVIVLEAIKLVAHKTALKSLTTFVRKTPTGSAGRRRALLCSEPLSKPNPNCYVCSKGMLSLSIDVEKSSLRMFVETICKARLGVLEPILTVSRGEFFNTLYECGRGLEDDEVEMYESNLDKRLCDLMVQSGSHIGVEDVLQNFKCEMFVRHAADLFPEKAENDRYELSGDVPSVANFTSVSNISSSAEPRGQAEDASDDAEDVLIVSSAAQATSVSDGSRSAKRARAETFPASNGGGAYDVIEISSPSAPSAFPEEHSAVDVGQAPAAKRQRIVSTVSGVVQEPDQSHVVENGTEEDKPAS